MHEKQLSSSNVYRFDVQFGTWVLAVDMSNMMWNYDLLTRFNKLNYNLNHSLLVVL